MVLKLCSLLCYYVSLPALSLLHLKIRSRFKFPRPLQCSLSSSDEKCKNIQFLKRSDTVFTGGRQIFQIPTKSVNFCKRVHFAFHSGSGFGDGLPSWALCAAFSFTMLHNGPECSTIFLRYMRHYILGRAFHINFEKVKITANFY